MPATTTILLELDPFFMLPDTNYENPDAFEFLPENVLRE